MNIKKEVKNFEYSNVKLKNSHWKSQRDETIEMYLNISNEDLLKVFRDKAGIETDAKGLVGWYGRGASTFGQKLGAFAKLYKQTGDYRLKEKAIYLLEEWMKCADKSSELFKNGTYVYDKLIGGFLDIYEYINYEKVMKYVSKLTDYAIEKFKREIKRDGLQDSGLTTTNMIEWYTLPENIYRAYQMTKDEKYKEFAQEWHYDYLWDKFYNKDFNIGPRHAYSQVNSFSSALRAYEETGKDKYLIAIKNGYDEITNHHMFATGGYGPAECIFSENKGYLGDSLKSTWDKTLESITYRNFADNEVARSDVWGSCEISCCAWAVFKACNYLIEYTKDAKYGDWVEKMLYNGTGGQLPIQPDGRVMYYADYFVDGGVKSVDDRRLQIGGESFEWQCCTGTFPQDVAEYVNMLYYYDNNSIYVSQYLPSKVKWRKDGKVVELENYSMFPKEEKLRFRISTKEVIKFSLKLRVPSWANNKNSIKVNDEDFDIKIKPNNWAIIEREWKDGDIVIVEYPFSLYFTSVDQKSSDIVALNYGPLVLVTDKMTLFEGDVDNPDSWIHQVENEEFTFETDKGHVSAYDFLTRKFKPYYMIEEMKWYFMYNRIK